MMIRFRYHRIISLTNTINFDQKSQNQMSHP